MTVTYSVAIKNDAVATDTNKYLYVELTKTPDFTTLEETTHTGDFTSKIGESAKAETGTITVAVGETLVLKVTITIDTAVSLEPTDLGLGFTLTAGATENKA